VKTLISAMVLLLSASAAMAEAPCQNPVATACQKACAVMGAKYVLAMREQNLQAGARIQIVRADAEKPLASAQHLARFADLSLDYIDGLTVREISGAIAAYCPK
jgi:hypothetical protein